MGIEYYVFALFIAALICLIAIICKVLFSNVKRQKKLLDEQESKILQIYTSVETLMEEFNEQVKMTTNELKDLEYRANSQAVQVVQASQAAQAASEAQTAQAAQTALALHMSNRTAFDLPPALEKKEQALGKLPRPVPRTHQQTQLVEANRIKAAGEVLEHAGRIIKSEAVIPASQNEAGVYQKEKEYNVPVFQKFFDDTAESTNPPPEVKTTRVQTRTDMILALSAEGKTDIEIASELGITRNEVLLVVGLKK